MGTYFLKLVVFFRRQPFSIEKGKTTIYKPFCKKGNQFYMFHDYSNPTFKKYIYMCLINYLQFFG